MTWIGSVFLNNMEVVLHLYAKYLEADMQREMVERCDNYEEFYRKFTGENMNWLKAKRNKKKKSNLEGSFRAALAMLQTPDQNNATGYVLDDVELD